MVTEFLSLKDESKFREMIVNYYKEKKPKNVEETGILVQGYNLNKDENKNNGIPFYGLKGMSDGDNNIIFVIKDGFNANDFELIKRDLESVIKKDDENKKWLINIKLKYKNVDKNQTFEIAFGNEIEEIKNIKAEESNDSNANTNIGTGNSSETTTTTANDSNTNDNSSSNPSNDENPSMQTTPETTTSETKKENVESNSKETKEESLVKEGTEEEKNKYFNLDKEKFYLKYKEKTANNKTVDKMQLYKVGNISFYGVKGGGNSQDNRVLVLKSEEDLNALFKSNKKIDLSKEGNKFTFTVILLVNNEQKSFKFEIEEKVNN
ncbi:hypothetical protein [Mycoplasma sp. CSL7503-lung]|uniref:hypothetical protein n=1 Tax=Mycoplasma sp. CSL7503-lung TaxID=536372 RepID=UPI0021D185F3|nr:hypothetical protein [Mycoplasma sp. CSL7503-lung]MCU4706754.1 hypothetical protein [Mycoplasma sp. CSL7503-lung]